MKKILILGAGIYQVPLIKKAKEMGLYVIVASIPGNYPGFQYADKVYYESTIDEEKIYQIAIEEKISAILTTGTDVAVKTIGYVGEKMGLQGVTKKVAECVTNKSYMKECLHRGNVRTAASMTARSVEEALNFAKENGFPLMFKCVDKSGSRGIIKVEDYKDIPKAFEYSVSYSNLDYIVVEKFIPGYEIGVDGYIDGENVLVVPHGKIVFDNGKTKVPVGHEFPFVCSKVLSDDITDQVKKTLKAVGLDKSFFNMDVMVSDEKSYVIEIGGRMGATCIPELLSIYLGCDIYEKMINNALGEKVEFVDSEKVACVGELLKAEKNGVISNVVLTDEVFVEQVSMDYKVGESVRKFEIGPDRIGHVIVKGKDLEEARENLKRAKEKILVEVI